MLISFVKWLIHRHSMPLGKGRGRGQKIRLVKLKHKKYGSLVKLGISDMKVIKETSDYVMVSLPSYSYNKLTCYHILD